MINNKGEINGITAGSERMDLSTSEGIEAIAKRIRNAYTKLTGGARDADDCVQEILCRMLEGKHQHQLINHAVIDYLRMQSGRKGSASYTERRNLANPNLFKSGYEIGATRIDYGRKLDGRRVANFIKKNFRGRRGEAVRMIYLENKSHSEVAMKLCISQSRVSQIMQGVPDLLCILNLLPKETKEWVARHAV